MDCGLCLCAQPLPTLSSVKGVGYVEQPLNTCHADGKMLQSSRPLTEKSKSAPLPSKLESFCFTALRQAVPWLPGRGLPLFLIAHQHQQNDGDGRFSL